MVLRESGTMDEGPKAFYTVRRAIFLMRAALGGGRERWNVAVAHWPGSLQSELVPDDMSR